MSARHVVHVFINGQLSGMFFPSLMHEKKFQSLETCLILNVTSATTLSPQMQPGLLNIEHIHSGCRSIFLLMNRTEYQGVAAVKGWRRMVQPRDAQYLVLDDRRKLCLECLDSLIMDTHECQPLYLEIQDFYEGLNMKVEQQIQMLLVERQALNEAMGGEKNVIITCLRQEDSAYQRRTNHQYNIKEAENWSGLQNHRHGNVR